MAAINLQAIQAYKNAEAHLKVKADTVSADPTLEKSKFGELLLNNVLDTESSLRQAEQIALRKTSGLPVDPLVLSQLTVESELKLHTLSALRNKIIEVYQETMRMPI